MSIRDFRGPAEKVHKCTTEGNRSHLIPEIWSGI